jgi:hypothetical protein
MAVSSPVQVAVSVTGVPTVTATPVVTDEFGRWAGPTTKLARP